MKQFISYPEIGQYRNICKSIKDYAIYNKLLILPTLKFIGTVKNHGTNASISFYKDEYWFQSRKNIITIEKDNAGFSFFAESNIERFKEIRNQIISDEIITIHGEWCGGNIQKGVAINGLPKMFIMFDVSLATTNEEKRFLIHDELDKIEFDFDNIFHIHRFKQYEMKIDFNKAQHFIPKLVEYTDEVEEKCPVGDYFGNIGIGEGIVWKCDFNDSILMFKTKGEKHSKSHVKKIKVTIAPEVLESIDKFVEYSCNENRLNQMYNELPEKDIKYTGEFIRLMMKDILKEELDVLKENNLEPKQIGKYVADKVRKWFMTKLDK